MQETSSSTKAGLDLERIRAALLPTLAAHGVSLVDIEWLTERVGWTLRLTIEREVPPGESGAAKPGSMFGPGQLEAGGVTLDDCAEVSREAASVLDAGELIHHQYHLEVSSPGLDRKLRSASEFERFAGKTAKVKLSRPAPDGQRLLRGTLASAPPGQVAVIVDGKRIEVPLADVEEARLVYELEAQPKPMKGARSGKAKSGKEPRGTKRR